MDVLTEGFYMSRMRCVLCAMTAATLLFASAAIARAGELQLTIANGRVTLVADSVPLRTILTEWARIGQTRIVNGEKLTGAPLTLRLIDVPEAQALDIVLRSASGYMAAPRPAGMAGASQYDRVVILASSRPTGGPAPAPNFQNVNPRFQTPPPMIQPVEGEDGDDEEVVDDDAAPRVLPPGFQAQPGIPIQVPPQPGATMTPGTMTPNMTPQQQLQLQQQMQQMQMQPQPGQVFAPVTSPRPGPVPVPQQPPQDPNKPIPR
jgi:hypothetical protein